MPERNPHFLASVCRVWVLLVALMLLSGCAVKLIYNQLDWLIPWYLDDYLELDGKQEAQFKKRLNAYLDWHRHNQLPEYSAFLRRLAADVEHGLNEQQIQEYQQQLEHFRDVLVTQMSPHVVAVFSQVTDAQLEALKEQFEEDNREYFEENIAPDETKQRRQRAREISRYIERWTGSLNNEQQQLVEQFAQQYQLMGEDFLAARKAWQKEFLRILALRRQPDLYEKALLKLLNSTDFGRTPQFNEKLEHNRRLMAALYFEIDKSLTDKQRSKAVKKLRSMAEDLDDLARQSS